MLHSKVAMLCLMFFLLMLIVDSTGSNSMDMPAPLCDSEFLESISSEHETGGVGYSSGRGHYCSLLMDCSQCFRPRTPHIQR